ncbi:MAG: twin-arginine translocase subunit TatC [Eubacteriales bacterium]|nr:twin-arginine translocase subunit TatC [Eubacteriales bacterium]
MERPEAGTADGTAMKRPGTGPAAAAPAEENAGNPAGAGPAARPEAGSGDEVPAERPGAGRTEEEPMEALPLMEHFLALRRVLIISMSAIVIGFLVVFFLWSGRLVQWVSSPLAEEGVQLIYTEVSEAFGAQTKMALIAGAVLGSPFVFGSVWWFVRPGLHRRERRAALVYLSAALVLFILGVMFAYRFVFFLAVNFFVTMGDNMAMPMFSLGKYVDFLFAFLVPFGIMFELPVLVIWLSRLGILTAAQLVRARKFIILAVFTVAAILTPPDVVSQCMLAFPLLVLFEVSVICCRVLGRKE